MGAKILELMAKIRDKPLTPEEKDLFLRIQEELGCDDDDAIWNIVALLEYQKLFYLALPEKIAEQSEKILTAFKKAAESEIKKAQGNLANQVVEGAKRINKQANLSTLALLVMVILIMFFLTCSLMMWAGYRLGAGTAPPPSVMFYMPSGAIIGLLFLGTAGILGYWTFKRHEEDAGKIWHTLAAAMGAIIVGGLLITTSF